MKGIFLDLETTGLNYYSHRVIEIGLKIVDLNSKETLFAFDTNVYQSEDVWQKRDLESISINGFSYDMVEKGMIEEDVKSAILQGFKKCQIQRGEAFFICQNPSFDRSFFAQIIPVYEQEELLWPYHWLDLASMYWSLKVSKEPQILIQDRLSLSKNTIAKELNLPEEKMPHKAMNGVDHLMVCYEALVGFPNQKLSTKEAQKTKNTFSLQ